MALDEQAVLIVSDGLDRGDIDLLDRELDRLRREPQDEGVPSIYREVQGLSGSEDGFKHRRDLMRQIFELNVELRQQLAESAPDPAAAENGAGQKAAQPRHRIDRPARHRARRGGEREQGRW